MDKLVEECTENVEEVNLAQITSTELYSAKHKMCVYVLAQFMLS